MTTIGRKLSRASLPLPGYDALGRKVIVSRPCCFDPYVIKPEDVEKVNYMVGEIMNEEDEQFFVNGMVGVIDMAGFNLGHLTQRPMTMIKKQTQYFQVSTPSLPFPYNQIASKKTMSVSPSTWSSP